MKQSIVVTATDTGVGKTLVAAALARSLAARGGSVGVMKPVETGVVAERRSDAGRLKRAARVPDPLDVIRPYGFRLPVAPLDASKSERRAIRIGAILRAYRRLRSQYEFLLVEGVGGVHVPITPAVDVLELIAKMDASVLVVGRVGIGGVNHALLTLNALRSRNIPVLALVLNRTAQARTAVARRQERSTAGLLRERAGVPLIGPLPYLQEAGTRFDRALATLAAHREMTKLTKLVLASARGSR
jgi:dethiobiotin synthetase